MRAYYTDRFVLPLPSGHTFPMDKYRLLREAILSTSLLQETELYEPPSASDEELLRVHDAGYLHRVQHGQLTDPEQKKIGFPWSSAMVERSRRSSGATIWACRSALEDGVGINLAGGTHHAFADRGEGYCVFNDAVVAIRALQSQGLIRRAVVIDTDVHQGNGTASICRDDPSIFTFSIHGARNFPLKKEQSDLDVALPDKTSDTVYLDALQHGLREALSASGAELVVFVSGADPYEEDRLGRLSLTMAGLAERDAMVFAACRRAGVPVALTMAGGYARQVIDTVTIHLQTIREAVG